MPLSPLFRKKPIDVAAQGAEAEISHEGGGHSLHRTLSAWDLTALGIGAIIGAGIFSATGSAVAGDPSRLGAGPALMISYVLTALACGFAALCYAEFAAMIPVSGSAYTYSYVTLGELAAWIIGWNLVLEYAIGNIAVAVSWSGYFRELLSGLGWNLPPWLCVDVMKGLRDPVILASAPRILGIPILCNLPAFGIVMLLTGLLYVGVKESARFNHIVVILKLVVVFGFLAVGAFFVKPDNWQPFAPNGVRGILTGAAVVFFSYIGFDAVSSLSEEAKNPQRDIPIGMFASLGICTVLYVVVTVVLTGLLPWTELGSENALVLALSKNGVHRAAGVLSFGAVIAMTAVLLVFQLGQPRIFFAMARDGLLPKWFAKVHPRFRTPSVATVLTGFVVGVPAAFLDISFALDMCNIGTLSAFVLVSAGVLVLRYAEPNRKRPFRCPAVPWVPILSIGTCTLLMLFLPALAWKSFGVWMVAGLVFYATYGIKNSRLRNKTRTSSG